MTGGNAGFAIGGCGADGGTGGNGGGSTVAAAGFKEIFKNDICYKNVILFMKLN